jgi:ABC-type glycerol-3-phosphate transport system permease component
MNRLWMTILLFLELTAMAVLAVAIRYGRFDQGPEFYVYVLGALAGVAVITSFVLPTATRMRAAVHGALLLGCAAFSLPFVWLVGTSFKYEEELLASPPRWTPAIPAAVERSPYLTDEQSPAIEPPEDVADWATLKPKLKDAIWQRAKPLLDPQAASAFSESDLRESIIRALWPRATGGIAAELWRGPLDPLTAAVAKRVDNESVDGAWDAVYNGVALRDVTVTDDDGITRRLGEDPSYLNRWTVQQGDATVRVPAAPATGPLLLTYNISSDPQVILAADLPLPVSVDQLLSVTIPIKQDRSWHSLKVAVEFDGKRYVASDDFYLGQRRWQEFTFRLAHKDARDERDVGVWPLVPSDDASASTSPAFSEPGKFRLTLTIDRASHAAATWHKFTSNYVSAYLASGHRWTYVFNSVYLVVLTVLGQVLSCSMVAYAFARLKWPGRDVLFIVLLATMMLPAQVTMIPVFVIFKHLGLYNTLASLWAPSLLGSAVFIFMLRQFMRTIPRELEDAARIDGCSHFGIYWRIILPLTKPALAAVAIFTFMATWNDLLGPLIYINDQRLYPLSLGLFELRTSPRGTDYGMLMAASTLMTIPVMLLFFAGQRYFIEGVTLTGMKA